MVTALSVTLISIIFFITTLLWYKSNQTHLTEVEGMLELQELMLDTQGNGVLVTNESNEIIYMSIGIRTLLEAIELPLSIGDSIQVFATRINRHLVGIEEITLKDLSLEPSVMMKERTINVSDLNKKDGSYLILVKGMKDSKGLHYHLIQTKEVTNELRNKVMNEQLLEFSKKVYKAQTLEELFHFMRRAVEGVFKSSYGFITLYEENQENTTTYYLQMNIGESMDYITKVKGVNPLSELMPDTNECVILNKSTQMKREIQTNQKVQEKDEVLLMTNLVGQDDNPIGFMGIYMDEEETRHDQYVKGFELMSSYLTQVIEKIIIDNKIKALAYFDPLTQLANRHKFLLSLEQEIVNTSLKNNQLLGVCFLDLKGFKYINESKGHEVGDYVLAILSQRLLSIENLNYEVGRLGGDEFGIYITCDQEDCVEKLCQEVITLLKQPVYKDDMVLTVSGNIGVSYYKKHGITPLELLKKADEALTIAKSQGDNCYHVNEESLR